MTVTGLLPLIRSWQMHMTCFINMCPVHGYAALEAHLQEPEQNTGWFRKLPFNLIWQIHMQTVGQSDDHKSYKQIPHCLFRVGMCATFYGALKIQARLS